MDNLPVIVIGAGGHARVLIYTLVARSVKILGLGVTTAEAKVSSILDLPFLGGTDEILAHSREEVQLVLGFGSIISTEARRRTFSFFKEKGYTFAAVIHPSAVIAGEVKLGEGVQVMAGVVIQPGCKIGGNTIVNTGTTVDHDCVIGEHVHLAPGVTLSGGVKVGSGTHVGTGVTVIQDINIGENCLLGAGALIIHDVPDNVKVIGHPGRIVEK